MQMVVSCVINQIKMSQLGIADLFEELKFFN